jgi:hypothetical protein
LKRRQLKLTSLVQGKHEEALCFHEVHSEKIVKASLLGKEIFWPTKPSVCRVMQTLLRVPEPRFPQTPLSSLLPDVFCVCFMMWKKGRRKNKEMFPFSE